MLKVTAGYSGTKCPADFVYSTKRNDTMKTKPITAVTLALLFLFVCLLSLPVDLSVSAASGNVYTCKLNRHYQHPVSGVIEDSGGKASFATGQGMVEGCTSDFAVMEESDSGHYYLTIRMSLMDFTSGHSFMVQNRGDTEWQETAAGITGTGSDTNGTTNDICIQVPSENAIVRGTMYVEPMGRSVIWYMYASDFTEGNTTDMNTLMVTSPSVKTTSESSQEPVESSAESSAQSTVESSVEESSQPAENSVEESSTEESSKEEPSQQESSQEESKIQKSSAQESKPESVAEESSELSMIPLPKAESAPDAEIQTPQTSHSEEYAPDNTRGLILSTEKEVKGASGSGTKPNSAILWVIVGCAACAAVAGVIAFIVKTGNNVRLNKEDDTEEYDEDGENDD